MSTNGIYNYHPVITEGPDKFKAQLATQQPGFFFGGSQVPQTLGIKSNIIGEGIISRNTIKTSKYKPVNKLVQFPTINKSSMIPKSLPFGK